MAILDRPSPPVLAELLGQHAVDGKPPQPVALLATVFVEMRVAGEISPNRPQCLLFQTEHRIAIDHPPGVQGPAGRGQLRQLGTEAFRAGHFLDPQVERVAIAAAAGMIGTALLRQHGRRGVQRIDQQHSRLETSRPLSQPPQITQIADSPTLLRAHSVKLAAQPQIRRGGTRHRSGATISRVCPSRLPARKS